MKKPKRVRILVSGGIGYEHEISFFLAAKVIALIESEEPKPNLKAGK